MTCIVCMCGRVRRKREREREREGWAEDLSAEKKWGEYNESALGQLHSPHAIVQS